jgi:hypothetical protein
MMISSALLAVLAALPGALGLILPGNVVSILVSSIFPLHSS